MPVFDSSGQLLIIEKDANEAFDSIIEDLDEQEKAIEQHRLEIQLDDGTSISTYLIEVNVRRDSEILGFKYSISDSYAEPNDSGIAEKTKQSNTD